MRAFTIVLALAFAGGAAVAVAAERSITQKGKAFSESEVTVGKGESLVFFNDDNVSHNILSTTAGHEFNLGSQAPGASATVTFKDPGEVAVVCAIHPRMKLTVVVQ
jgi:plastocyanin